MKYRKKPIVIEAVKYDGKNSFQILSELGMESIGEELTSDDLLIDTPEGEMRAKSGDYIIKGIKGEFYPCKPDIFEASYDLVKENKLNIPEEIQNIVKKQLLEVLSQREEIIIAFIAKYGCNPEEIEQVEQRTKNGTIWFLRKKNFVCSII